MMRRAGAAVSAFVLLTLAILGMSPAGAADNPALTIRSVDATDSSHVSVTFAYSGDRDAVSDLVVREGDQAVDTTEPVPLAQQQALGVVLVIDASGSMAAGGLIDRVKEAAHEFVAKKAVTDEIAIVSFSRQVRTEQDFTTDKAQLDAAIDQIALQPDTSLYDAIVRGSELFKSRQDLQPNLIVFSDGGDTTSTADAHKAQASVDAVGAALFAAGVENDGFHVLEQMAAETGGASAVASDPSQVSALFDAVDAKLHKQYVTTFKSTVESGTVPLTLTIGEDTATAQYIAGSQQQGQSALKAQPVEEPSGPLNLPSLSLFRGNFGLFLGLLLGGAAIAVLAFTIGLSFFDSDTSLRQALRPYSEGFVASADDGGDEKDQGLAQTPLLQRAVEATGEFAERRGVLTTVEARLERANLPLRPAEALFFYMAGVVVVTMLAFALTQSFFKTLLVTVFVAMIPPFVVNYLAGRRQKKFNSLLPDTLQLLASTLRAGYSLMQGVEAVSQEVSEPVGRELRRVVTEARLGRPLEESLEQVALRMESADFAWAVMAIRIQREVGGNLAELLVTVAETMTERERLRRDVNALTAEGRISAIVLGCLPVGLGLFIKASNPDYLDPLFNETIGKFLLIGALGLMLFGFWWMKKCIEIDI